ncbi:carbohydrate esterase family 16 protein [Sphaerobolus stellatus SS14]|uniref:Carbohydrate esterase family 16 protein n=1 Tax=Sphaerobolus stellatus (strain SS14) TaxID=990650 RepID=A0A0C9VIM4_SPHS4|nr:carbohydrate esterase family 16 protein [Sphaerobolus stellatus SS14]
MVSFLLDFVVGGFLFGAAQAATAPARNDGIHLAVSPKCGTLTATSAPADVNAGLLALSSYKTLVTFGDSYTDGGVRTGGPLLPAVVVPPNPRAGGRETNGPVWAEGLVADTGAVLKDYAVGGAVTDAKLWPSKANASDFVTQVQLFLNQSNNLNPATTLYSSFFGINDVAASSTDGTANLPVAAQTIIDQITLLTQPPTNARHFLVLDDYGFGSESTAGDAFKQKYFTGLFTLSKKISGFKVAFVDFKTIWSGLLTSTPGFKAFGYTSSGACTVNSSSTVGECSDPAHTFYWIPGHPSKETHRIMADYVEEVLTQCT